MLNIEFLNERLEFTGKTVADMEPTCSEIISYVIEGLQIAIGTTIILALIGAGIGGYLFGDVWGYAGIAAVSSAFMYVPLFSPRETIIEHKVQKAAGDQYAEWEAEGRRLGHGND